jgi:hypothetical protein
MVFLLNLATEVAATNSQSPPTRTLSPTKVGLCVIVGAVSTARRRCQGVGVTFGVLLGVGVFVMVAVPFGVLEGVGVCVTFGVLVNVGVAVGEGVVARRCLAWARQSAGTTSFGSTKSAGNSKRLRQ